MDTSPSVSRPAVVVGLFAAAAAGGALALAMLVAGGSVRLAIAAVLVVLAAVATTQAPRPTLVATLVYLGVMAEVRRLLLPSFGWSGSDPLLLVGPATVGALALSLVVRRRLTFETPLAKAVAVLMVVMALQVLNPAQGGLMVGVGGTLFYVVPLVWYWLGREFGDEAFAERVLLRGVLPLAVVASGYGLFQFFEGLPAHQQMWIDIGAAPAAIYTSFGVVKPFAFFEAAQALAIVASMAAVVCVAYAVEARRWGLLAWLPLFAAVLFVIASRGPWVKLAAVLALAWAVRAPTTTRAALRLVPAAVVAFALLSATFARVQSAEFDGALAVAATHQADGLLDPFDTEASTAGVHTAMLVNGLLSPLERPLGAGLGATTLAAKKYGGQALSSEVDFANLFYSLGVFGVVYLVVMALVFAQAYRRWREERSAVALAVLLLLVFLTGSWLRGTLYFVTALTWLLVGCQEAEARRAAAEPA